MAKNSIEIFNEKVNLIYEYDNQSPLFARVASIEIENNDVDKGIEILVAGMKKFPNFSVAHFLLSKAYMLIGNYNLALRYVKSGSELLSSPRTVDHYMKEIENIKKQRSLFELTKHNPFFSDYSGEESDDPGLFDDVNIPEINREKLESIDERLDQIAREISNVKFDEASNVEGVDKKKPESSTEKSTIISETLAKIYIAQGELNEAIKIFNKLKNKYPEKSAYYADRIKEITEQLNK